MRAARRCLLICTLCASLTAAEEGEIPQEIIEKLLGSEILGISDLQHLLGMDTLENDTEETSQVYHKEYWDSSDKRSQHIRHKRSIEQAVLASCKTRTAIYEIPRSQVDHTAANFFIWPPCVEVKRCTGCCNTSDMRCSPRRKYYRTVKAIVETVAKVEFVKRKPRIREVRVQLEDHLDCWCRSVSEADIDAG